MKIWQSKAWLIKKFKEWSSRQKVFRLVTFSLLCSWEGGKRRSALTLQIPLAEVLRHQPHLLPWPHLLCLDEIIDLRLPACKTTTPASDWAKIVMIICTQIFLSLVWLFFSRKHPPPSPRRIDINDLREKWRDKNVSKTLRKWRGVAKLCRFLLSFKHLYNEMYKGVENNFWVNDTCARW